MFYVFQFDEYCAPILHLAGIPIDVVKTDSEGHARRYIEELESLPETILVAGGDGTVSEAVTGKLDHNCHDFSLQISQLTTKSLFLFLHKY